MAAKGIAFVFAAAGLVASARPADACSQGCISGGLLPEDGATIPANARGFLWTPSFTAFGEPTLRLTRVGDPTPLAITVATGPSPRSVTLAAPLVVDAQYVLEEVDGCEPLRATFTAGPEAPLPSTLGTLHLDKRGHREIQVEDSRGGCSVMIDAGIVDVTVELSAEAEPWKDVLAFSTFVDGIPWRAKSHLYQTVPPGASWQGRGEDRIFRACREPSVLTDDPHEVEISARVPGMGNVLSTQTERTTVSCSDGGGCATNRPATLGFVLLALLLLVQRTRR